MTPQSEQPWIEWTGGECPVDPDALVEAQYLAPVPPEAEGVRMEWPVPAWRLAWHHDGENDDIIAYRIIQP